MESAPTSTAPVFSVVSEAGETVFTYKAFISYSHKDEVQAEKIHKELERYRIPKNLRTNGATLGAIFRDRDELPAASGLDATIKAALRASECLIVLCSPYSAQSIWVDKEISYFLSLGREDKIFTAILSGEPYAKKSGFDESEECLPKSIRYELTETGELGAARAEPLAADFRPQGDGPKLGVMKLVSGLMGLGLDRLLQRQLIRARRRTIAVTVSAIAIVSVFAGLSWATHNAQLRAEAHRADAENFVEFLLSDLSLKLETSGRLDLLNAVGVKAVEYYDQFEENEFDPHANGRRARAWHLVGNLQNSLGELEKSETFFDQAYVITKDGLAGDQQNPNRIFEHAQSAYYKSLPLRRLRNLKAELIQLEEYLLLSERLQEVEGDTSRSLSQLALACMNLGRVRLGLEDIDGARTAFAKAEALYVGLNEQDQSVQNLLYRTENMAWMAELHNKWEKDFQKSYEVRVKQSRLLDEQLSQSPEDFRLIEASAYAKLGLGNAASFVAKYEDAKVHLNLSLVETHKALWLEPRREKMRRAQSVVLLSLMRIALIEENASEFKEARAALVVLQTEPMTMAISDSNYWDEVIPSLVEKRDRSFEKKFGMLP